MFVMSVSIIHTYNTQTSTTFSVWWCVYVERLVKRSQIIISNFKILKVVIKYKYYVLVQITTNVIYKLIYQINKASHICEI